MMGCSNAGGIIFADINFAGCVLDDDDVKWVRGESRHGGKYTNGKSINNKQT